MMADDPRVPVLEDDVFGERDTPPDKSKAPPEPKAETPKPKVRPPVRKPPLKKQLEDVFATIAVAIAATGDAHCANVVASQAEPLAEAWSELAKVNPRVKAVIEKMLTGSAWGQVIFVSAATVIPIAAHHGLIPRNFPMPFSFGFGPPPPPSDEVTREQRTAKTDGKNGGTQTP